MAAEEETAGLPEVGVRPFSQFLIEQRDGAAHQELSEKLAEVVAAAVALEKPGSVTLKLSIRLAPGGTFAVFDEITAKVPQADRPASLFYPDRKGGLHRRNPNQPELPLREVPRQRAAGETS